MIKGNDQMKFILSRYDAYCMTKVSPNYENDFQYTAVPGGSDGCGEPGCYTDNISYDVQMDQIEALISISEFCYQEVVNNCISNHLTNFAWWLDRNGNKYQN